MGAGSGHAFYYSSSGAVHDLATAPKKTAGSSWTASKRHRLPHSAVGRRS